MKIHELRFRVTEADKQKILRIVEKEKYRSFQEFMDKAGMNAILDEYYDIEVIVHQAVQKMMERFRNKYEK